MFELSGQDVGEAQLLVDGSRLEALRGTRTCARWRWSPGFQAGETEFELRLPDGRTRRARIVTDADTRKLTRDDFDAMVRDILEDTFALFSLSPFRRAVSRGAGGPVPPIARLEFLRTRIGELEQVVARIRRAPRRRLRAEEAVLPWHKARHATGTEIVRSFRSGRVLRENHQPPRLPVQLRGHLPELIRVRRRTDTFDLPEHREMAACLRSWRDWLRAVSGRLSAASLPGSDGAAWAARLQALALRVERMRQEEPFAALPDAPATLTITSLFRNDPTYRDFHRLWRDMNLGIASVFGDFLAMPLSRTFELYELWCYLRLARAVADRWGVEGDGVSSLFGVDGAGLTIASSSLVLSAGGGWRLAFQPRYAEFWTRGDGRGSYSRPMTPDIALWRQVDGVPTPLVVLDAKYRVDQGLADALTSTHTYRDAIVDTKGGVVNSAVAEAYLLTPHQPAAGGQFETLPMPDRLFAPDYHRAFRFGALTLRPGMQAIEVAASLDAIASGLES
ncbi:DUF2357 domain-containing protein [Sphingomonas sp. BK345]|uniref:DUF2357 domain-containing protein n=1 Tax=Sphingomonas sp. BK345 TaxID=2586980 RepID=UPI001839468B|nr:DUF2357 domain-containing protein [Sphingomonas sp. BK345]MBB3472743.1 hypothetical protein [Sphingomonas sp. BK345]